MRVEGGRLAFACTTVGSGGPGLAASRAHPEGANGGGLGLRLVGWRAGSWTCRARQNVREWLGRCPQQRTQTSNSSLPLSSP